MMWWYGTGMHGWGYALLGVGTVLLFLIVALVAFVVAAPAGDRAREDIEGRPMHRTPEQIVAERFARGEIDEPEYRRLLDVLHAEEQPSVGH